MTPLDPTAGSPAADDAARSAFVRATSVRWVVVGVTFLAAFLLYLHRFCMSYAQRYMKEDLGLTNEQLGYCYSAFFVAYALGQVPSGWLSDRFGGRRMLTLYILVWSLFTGLMGVAAGFVMLFVLRLAAGLGQAGAYPTSASLVSKWIPFSQRGTASSLIAFGGRLGGGVAPVLTALLIVGFVPVGASSRLTRDDLLNVGVLCAATQDEGSEPSAVIARRLYDSLPPDVRDAVRRLAAEEERSRAPEMGERSEIREPGDESDGVPSLPLVQPADAELVAGPLVAGLNALVVEGRIDATVQLGELPLEREARRLLDRVGPLSNGERERLNRLVLEALFPDAIRKIYVHGWRKMMAVYGSLGLLVAALYWFLLRDNPALHPWCNDGERALIEHGRPPGAPQPHGKPRGVPIGRILASRSLWMMCITQWGSNVGWVFLVTWLPRYLLEVHNVPLVARGWMAAVPLWCGWCGMLLGGRITDRATRRLGLRWGRALPIAGGRFLAAAAYVSCLWLDSPWVITIAFGVVAFSTDVCSGSIWAFKQDVGGRYVGSIHGWANMWGNLGAAVSPLLVAWVVGAYDWNAAFAVCGGAFLIAGLAAVGIDASIPIAPPDEDE